MQELKCPDCGYLNPDIRELGYTLPATCNRCRHVWRLQDFNIGQITPEMAFEIAVRAGIYRPDGSLTERFGGTPNAGGERRL